MLMIYLNLPISKIIFEGPEDKLNLTENTQPAIFLTSYAIFNVAKKEFGINFDKANLLQDIHLVNILLYVVLVH